PYVNPDKAKQEVRSQQSINLARQVAQESVVLLKNQNNTLPFKKTVQSIAVIGPNANNMYNQLGDYTAPQDENNIVTVFKGIQNKLPNAVVKYVKGCDI